MNTAVKEKETCVLVIFGHAPELWPGAAYRRRGHFDGERQKIIKCPYCGKRLTAIDVSTKVELFRYPRKTEVSCHEYRRCYACRETVGIVFNSG